MEEYRRRSVQGKAEQSVQEYQAEEYRVRLERYRQSEEQMKDFYIDRDGNENTRSKNIQARFETNIRRIQNGNTQGNTQGISSNSISNVVENNQMKDQEYIPLNSESVETNAEVFSINGKTRAEIEEIKKRMTALLESIEYEKFASKN
jgi:hypothetical protein